MSQDLIQFDFVLGHLQMGFMTRYEQNPLVNNKVDRQLYTTIV